MDVNAEQTKYGNNAQICDSFTRGQGHSAASLWVVVFVYSVCLGALEAPQLFLHQSLLSVADRDGVKC